MSLVGRSKDINYVVARAFHAMVAPLVGWRFTVEGHEHLDDNKPAVVLGNHQTMIDILCKSNLLSVESDSRPSGALEPQPRSGLVTADH